MWARASAGVLAGFFVTAALIGLVCWSFPGPWQRTMLPGLVAFLPLWIGVICTGFLFRNGRHAWLWLGGIALAGLVLLWVLQSSGWVQ
jgi:hypothetical protein